MRQGLFTYRASGARFSCIRDLILIVAAMTYLVTALGAHRWSSCIGDSGPTLCKATGVLSSPSLDSDVDGDQSPDSSSVPTPDPALLPQVALYVPQVAESKPDAVFLIPTSHIQEIPLRPPEQSRA